MLRFKSKGREIIAPHLYGVTKKDIGRNGLKWTEKEFFDTLEKNVKKEVADIVKELYEWGEKTLVVDFGAGKKTPSAFPDYFDMEIFEIRQEQGRRDYL